MHKKTCESQIAVARRQHRKNPSNENNKADTPTTARIRKAEQSRSRTYIPPVFHDCLLCPVQS